MKLFITLFLLSSCEGDKPSAMHPDFEKNKELAMKFIELHSSEDWEAQAALIHEDLDWAQPVYGSENYGKEALIKKLEGDVASAEADLRVFLAEPKVAKAINL